MKDKKFKRKSFLIKKSFQLRYVGLSVFVLLMTIGLLGVNLYYQMSKLVMDNPDITGISNLIDNINIVILAWIICIIILVVFAGIFISHRIAGPMIRMEEGMKKIAKGDITDIISLRKSDELKELVDTYNHMVSSLKDLITNQKEMIQSLNKRIEVLCEEMHSKSLSQKQMESIRLELNTLRKEILNLAQMFKIQ